LFSRLLDKVVSEFGNIQTGRTVRKEAALRRTGGALVR